MSDIDQRKAAALQAFNKAESSFNEFNPEIPEAIGLDLDLMFNYGETIRELLQPSPRVKHAMHPSEISIEDLNSIANAEVPVAAGPFEKSVPDGFDEITNEKELQHVADGEVDEAIEYMGECAKVIMEQESADIFKEEAKHLRTLIRAAQRRVCSDGELLEQIRIVRTGDQTHNHKWILAVEAVCKAAQQPRQECPHNCPHCYAIEVRNNLPSPPKETR